MNEEERRRLYELGFGNIPITTTRYAAPYTAQVTAPSWGVGLSSGTPMITWGTPKDLPTQEATGGISWPEKPTTYDYQDIVQDIVDEQKFTTEVPSQAEIDVAAEIDSFAQLNEPTYGLAASDPNLQGVTPFSMASTAMTPAQINAGMAQVADSIQHVDATYGGETIPSPKDAEDRRRFKEAVEKLPTTGWMGNVSNWAISKVLQHGIPYTGFSGDNIQTATTAESMVDVLNNLAVMDAKKAGIPKDDLIAGIVTGVNPLIQTSEEPLAAAAEYVSKGGKLDQDDARQMAFQVDEFVDLTPATTPSTISKVSRPSTKKAAVGTKKNEAEEREKARMRALAKQQAAAQRKRDVAKAKAAKAQEAMVQAALERAAQAQAERAMVDRAKAIMGKYAGRREPAENYMSAEERDVVAAAQVDTFAGIGDRSGEVREAMRSVGYGGPEWT